MAGSKETDLKLRAAFMGSAALLMVTLALIDAFITNISWLTVWLIPAIFFSAVISMLLIERKRRRRASN